MLVLVTGVPGAGKSTLAAQLAVALAAPLLSRDAVKESLFDSLGVRDRAWALSLGRASARVIWSLVASGAPAAVVDIWLDPLRGDHDDARDGLAAAGITGALEVLCRCPGEVAAQRYAARHRHPGHLGADESTLQRIREAAAAMTPLGVGPSIEVDTTAPVDVAALAQQLRSL
jgi:glucokinase